jgi:Haemolysin-type calcium binding protein related domain
VQSGNDLIVAVKDPAHPGAPLTDTITLQHWFDDPKDRIEKFVFADGTTLDLSSGVLAPYLVPFGETLSGSSVVEKSAIGTVVGTVTGFDFSGAGLSYSASANEPHPDRSRRVKARGTVRAAGWRRAQRPSASMACIHKRFA